MFLCWVSLNGRMTLSMKGTLAAVSWAVLLCFERSDSSIQSKHQYLR